MTRTERITLLGLFAATTVFTLGDGSMQILIAPYLQEQGLTQSVIGPLVAGYSVAALVFRFVTGSIYRPERTWWLVPTGCAMEAVAFILIARADRPGMLAALIALNGAGFALASTGGLAAIMDVTDGRNAGSVMGWYTGCIGAGYALAGFLGGWLGDALGLASAITTIAFIPLVAGTALGLALRRAGRGARRARRARRASTAVRGWRGAASFDLGGFKGVTPAVWLAVAVALHINLVSGVLITFFPLYGLAIGLSLTQIGTLTGLHSAVGSFVRFLTPAIFRMVDYRALLPWVVVLGAVGVAGLTLSPAFGLLLAAWLLIGLSRGLLRVASAALATEATTSAARGATSGLYLAGLDVGKVIGPLIGGVSVEFAGYRPTFLAAALLFPLVFFALDRLVAARSHESSA